MAQVYWVAGTSIGSGSSSAVEHLLAKEGVAGSNPVFRSSSQLGARLDSRAVHFINEADKAGGAK